MVVFKLIVSHQTIGLLFQLQNGVNVLSQMVFKNPVFGQKAPNFVNFGPYDFVQISLACGTNIMCEEILDFQYQH